MKTRRGLALAPCDRALPLSIPRGVLRLLSQIFPVCRECSAQNATVPSGLLSESPVVGRITEGYNAAALWGYGRFTQRLKKDGLDMEKKARLGRGLDA